MDRQEQIDLIATKIHGWHFNNKTGYWEDSNNDPVATKEDFDPPTNISQAIEALKKFCKDNKVYWCLGWTSPYDDAICSIQNKDGSIIAQAKHLKDSEAICLCLIEAIGGKG
jgi:hypothetical protein